MAELSKTELRQLSFPADDAPVGAFPLYDRWADAYNVSTEFVINNQARSLASERLGKPVGSATLPALEGVERSAYDLVALLDVNHVEHVVTADCFPDVSSSA